jgi:hypothetical protein
VIVQVFHGIVVVPERCGVSWVARFDDFLCAVC